MVDFGFLVNFASLFLNDGLLVDFDIKLQLVKEFEVFLNLGNVQGVDQTVDGSVAED